ncbi:MAG: hypothetical protein PHN59_07205 [Candidatus Omnitrophica bacterium]|nr:hypothetical protein [Candidatus Omnitrophota bacterium]
MIKKKNWKQPIVTVLNRGNKEELVLTGCKLLAYSCTNGGPDCTNSGCLVRYASYCFSECSDDYSS